MQFLLTLTKATTDREGAIFNILILKLRKLRLKESK